jgi:hypothetical protein
MAREKSAVEHDDLIDALTMGGEYLSEKLEISEQERLDDYEKDRLQQAIDEFNTHAGINDYDDSAAITDTDFDMTDSLKILKLGRANNGKSLRKI